MTTNVDFDRTAQAWLAGGPTELSDHVLDAALREIHVTSQRRRVRLPWSTRRLPLPLGAAAMVGIVVLASVIALSVFRPQLFGGPGPTATPVPTSTPTPTPTRAPSSIPPASPRIPGATLARDGVPLSPGVRYVLPDFEPAFTFTGSGITFGVDGRSYAWFEHSTSGATVVGVVQPKTAFAEGGATQPVPADLVGWLQERGDLVVSSVTPVTLGSVEGTLLEATVPTDAFHNAGDAINVLCPNATGCDFESGGSIGYGPGQHVLILVTTVGGVPVTAMVGAPQADWDVLGPDLDAFLRSFEFAD